MRCSGSNKSALSRGRGQHEAVASRPGDGLVGFVVQGKYATGLHGNVSHTHPGTRVTGFDFLYCVYAQRTNSVRQEALYVRTFLTPDRMLKAMRVRL